MDGLGKYLIGVIDSMYNFRYVSKKEAAPVKEDLLDIIHEVQDRVRDEFTFKYTFVGSSARNMITCDVKSNIGFDFDVNIEVNDEDQDYSAKELRDIIREALNKVARKYGYDYCEDSTRVLTIKVKDRENKRILHSCDFAIVYNLSDGRQQYIRFNKDQQNYTWEFQGQGFYELPNKIDWLKENNLWDELKEYYLYKKNTNTNPDKHSRSIFAESITEMCQKTGYYSEE